ncbi:hypothetical protein A8H35_19460 [Burkholderia thailandensis]|nr:hypothetical protein A8H31_12065 [Burkholderia thailandensis]AWY62543.1 hypothetical protein A8H35_19460 [Burkholderia thailandensis]AWY66061.1 hypothetical protein A8H36_04530 [Burkholderia thailandensis]NOK41345.1 hypothetical protein [Burkholderia thailandensis]NOK52495.1 hypothetical protein [Burkholderia thailandensis]
MRLRTRKKPKAPLYNARASSPRRARATGTADAIAGAARVASNGNRSLVGDSWIRTSCISADASAACAES